MSNMESRHPDDAAPIALNGGRFPLGDIYRGERHKKEDELLQLQAAWNEEDFHRSIRLMALKGEQSSPGKMNHHRIVAGYKVLADAWPAALDIKPQNRGRQMARHALFSTKTFTKDLLPPIKQDFGPELELMASFDDDGLANFAWEAWATMKASHPSTHHLLEEFEKLLADRTCNSTEEYILVDACIVLPYLLSSSSRLLELSQHE